jgi:hypothetical protein
MPEVSQEIVLNAVPSRVWEFVTTLRHLPRWMDGIASVQAISDPKASIGTTFTAVRRGRPGDETWLVAEWEAPHRLRLLEYHRKLELIIDLAPARDGARMRLQYNWPSERGILDRLFRPTAQRQMVERSLARLQELIKLNQDIKLLHGMGDE